MLPTTLQHCCEICRIRRLRLKRIPCNIHSARGQGRRGHPRGGDCGYGHMDAHCATRVLIDTFKTETQFSEPEQTFPRRHTSNLSTEREWATSSYQGCS